MGLFSKKPPCAICGGKVSWLLPSKIEGEYVCTNCYNKIDMDSEKARQLTMQGFREYLAFYDENQLLKSQFNISEVVDLGLFDTKIAFDYTNKLFCMSKNLDKTIFEGKLLKSFIIKEDNTPLYEGSAAGVKRYTSTVPDRAMAMGPEIIRYVMSRQLAKTLDKLDDGKENFSAPTTYCDITEPFRSFNIEFHMDHPYWTVIKCDMEGPRFSNDNPDVNDYLNSYRFCINELEKLVTSIKTISFPTAPEQFVNLGMSGVQAAAAPQVDSIEEIKRYKELMEQGIISQQEFDAKKKQLLGI